MKVSQQQIRKAIARIESNESRETRVKPETISRVVAEINQDIVNRLRTENEIRRIRDEQLRKISLFGSELVPPLNDDDRVSKRSLKERDRAFYYKDKCRQIYAKLYLG